MRPTRYLNTILTLLALLLALQLWTTWTQTGPTTTLGVAQAHAAAPAIPGGIPDSGAQQKEMIDLLKLLVQKVQDQTDLWRSGEVKVRVEKAAPDDKGR